MALQPISMSDPIFDDISNKIRKSYPNACILWIDEVINPILSQEYEIKKKEIEELRGKVKEIQLFHGTSTDAIHNIAKTGFDPQYNRVSAYGIGTYFAVNASYSFGYMRIDKNEHSYMILADVLLGNIVQGYGLMKVDTTKYDNTVDNINNPTIYTTPYGNGAYPRYIIAFHKNAK